MGFHPNEPNYLKDIRFVLTLDYQNLARLFTRRWFKNSLFLISVFMKE